MLLSFTIVGFTAVNYFRELNLHRLDCLYIMILLISYPLLVYIDQKFLKLFNNSFVFTLLQNNEMGDLHSQIHKK